MLNFSTNTQNNLQYFDIAGVSAGAYYGPGICISTRNSEHGIMNIEIEDIAWICI